jgi:hypothetical protein
MKMTKILFIAAILIFAIALFSCKDEGGLGLPGTQSASKLPAFTETAAPSSEAKSMLNYALNLLFIPLTEANEEAYDAAFKAKNNGQNIRTFLAANSDKKSITINVPIEDTTILKGKLGVNGASIKGKSDSSGSSNKTIAQIIYILDEEDEDTRFSLFSDKDTFSASQTIKKTFEIPDFYAGTFPSTLNAANGYSYTVTNNIKVAGVITVEGNKSGKVTLKEKIKNKSESSMGGISKVSVALTITNRTECPSYSEYVSKNYGAKITLSSAKEADGKGRYAESSSGYIYSDVKVYGNDNKELYTFNAAGYLDLFHDAFFDSLGFDD